jgi:osmotically-inducible protein OsmY
VKDTEARSGSVLGIVVTAVAAFAVGTFAGMALGGAVGAVNGGRVRDTFGKLRRVRKGVPPEELEQAVLVALHEDEATSDLDLHVHVADGGLVELTGVVSDATLRKVAGDVARAVPGVEVVVNRIMLRAGERPAPTPHSL